MTWFHAEGASGAKTLELRLRFFVCGKVYYDGEGKRQLQQILLEEDLMELRQGETGRKVALEDSRYMRRLRDILGMERKGGA